MGMRGGGDGGEDDNGEGDNESYPTHLSDDIDIVAAFVKDVSASDYNPRDEKDPVSSEAKAEW